jgi:hypothetical protein
MPDAGGGGREHVSQLGVMPEPVEPPPAESSGPRASAPVGRAGAPIEIDRGTKAPATIDGIPYSGHALDRAQGRGIPPSVVQDTIGAGQASPGNDPGTTVYYSPTNNVMVVIDKLTGRVVTVRQGKP